MDGAALIPEFEHEAALTRTMLSRVPYEQGEWKPHEKSFAMWALAEHLADLPNFVPAAVDGDSLELDPSRRSPASGSVEELLERFDRNVAEAKAALGRATAEGLGKTWSLTRDGAVLLSMPKAAVIRTLVLNHAVHHRAQLGVYLRLLDLPVPSTYGPSADEQR